MRITKTFIDKVAPPALKANQKSTQAFYRDHTIPGFALRVTSNGAKSFIIEKRVNGKVKRMTLGRYGNLTLEQAKRKAMQLLGDVAFGIDPIAEKKAKHYQSISLIEAFNDYLLTRKDLKSSTIIDYKSIVKRSFIDWYNKPLVEITKDMVELRHQQIGEKSISNANKSMRVLRAIFNHAKTKYEDINGNSLISVNPVERISQTRGWYKVKKRDTLIKAHQLKSWFDATLLLNNETTRDYLHFLLFTGLRRSEAATLTWVNIDFIDKTLTITETKNHQTHTLPLSDFLENLLKRRYEFRSSSYIFPGNSKKGYLSEPRKSVLRVSENSGVEFRLHDLRRTFITIAESLDIPAYALKRLLNHKDPNDVTAGYIVSDVNRLREPMQKVTSFIFNHFQTMNTENYR